MTTVGSGDVGGIDFRNRRNRRIIRSDRCNDLRRLSSLIPKTKERRRYVTDQLLVRLMYIYCLSASCSSPVASVMKREREERMLCVHLLYIGEEKEKVEKSGNVENLSLVFSRCVRHNI